MPNWCNNTVEISHPNPAKMYELVGAINEGKFCNYAKPVPESLHIVAGSVGDPVEQKKLEEATARNLELHGYGNWYDFCANEWGTKWDVDPYDKIEYDDQHDKNGITFGFDSAWAPPCGVYEALIEQGFSVRAYYYEGGMNFAGIWDNGDEDFYELPATSAECREQLPTVLDEMFCISENMEMWEEDNAEE